MACRCALPLFTLALGLGLGLLLGLHVSGALAWAGSCVVGDQRQSPALRPAQAAAAATLMSQETTTEIETQAQDASTTLPPVATTPDPAVPTTSTRRHAKDTGIQSKCLDETGKNCRAVRPRCSKPAFPGGGATMCPEDKWADAMVKLDPSPDKIIINIGCNKGDDAVVWLQRFDQHDFWKMSDWKRKGLGGGFCKANLNPPKPPKSDAAGAPVAVCVEAVPKTAKALVEGRKRLGYDSRDAPGQFHIMHAAVSDIAAPNQTVLFTDAPVGFEQAGLTTKGDYGQTKKSKWDLVPVPAYTVDGIAEQFKFPRVDILVIDTEGGDPAILRGSDRALETVRYLQFEVHRDIKGSHWANTTVLSVVEELDGRGFDCYWAGNNGKLVSLTHCWSERSEHIGMSNIACVKRDDVWWEVMESFCPGSELE